MALGSVPRLFIDVKLLDVDTLYECSVHPTLLWCYNPSKVQVPTQNLRMQVPCPHLATSEQPSQCQAVRSTECTLRGQRRYPASGQAPHVVYLNGFR